MNRSNIYNVIHISFSFVLIFMSFGVTQLFQTSSDHAKDGAFAVGIIYVVFSLANLALSSHLTHLLGVRLTLVVSSLTYVLFIAANIKYYQWMLYTSAFLLGLGAALFWTAQGVYVTLATNEHERVNGLASSSTRGLMNGIFLGLLYLHLTLGNLLVSFLFYSNLPQWIIFTVMTAIAGLGTISLICLRPMKMPENTGFIFIFIDFIAEMLILYLDQRSILSRLTILRDLPFLLLVPSMSYLGFAQGFIFAAIPPLIVDNSRKFLIFTFYGIVTAVCSIVFGRLSDSRIRRLDIFILGAFSHTVIFALLLTKWTPPLDQSHIEKFIIIVVGLGIGESLFTSQLSSTLAVFYGFTRPADAFASLRVFQSGCTALIYVAQVYISLRIRLFGLIILASLAVVTLIYEHYGVKSLDTGKTNMEVQGPSITLPDMKIDDGLPLNTSTNATVL